MNNWILPDKSTDKAKELFQKAEERNALLEKSRSPNYVLLDAALWGTAINDLFKDENTSFRSLFKGSAGDELWNAAPYLVETSPNGTFLEKINEIIRTGNPNRRATWLSSPLGIDGLCKHLRRFLRLRKEDGGHLYFRFYDPYVANVVFPNLTKGQASNFFEKIEFLVTEDANMKKTSKIALLVILSMCWLKFHIYAFEEPIIIMKVKIIGHSSDSINPCEQKIVKELNDAIKWGNVKKVSQILDTNKNIQTKYIDEAIRTIKYYPNTKILLNLFKYRKIEINDEIIYEPDKHVSLVRYDCIKLLLKYVCGFKDVLSNEGATDEKLKLYLKAVRRNDYEMLELLGFDDESIKLPSCEGETVLTTAVRDNNVEMVKYLLEHGIDKEQREIADCFDEPMGEENAYEIAVRLGYEEIIDLLK